ncbi:uncharacterized protein LOC128740591 [Sabethes cyaneus]|uniref:uncharacterized protein LOC128740591 n=1 Tax=Sabethes cyaneus TaxID=53552 RepID=UPI00237DEDD7|nr:uncharacterized protein LOC128740591 [Sabethes cyaneus]
MVKVTLYTLHFSPPCRAVELTAKALGIELDQKVVNLLAGEHLKPDFLKLNPQHTVPVLDDNGTILSESHAIMIYLVSKYGKDDSLYPKDLVQQAKVNAALHFESGVLFARMRFLFESILFGGSGELPVEKTEYIKKAYQLLEDTLVDDYVAGKALTIADFSCVSSFASVIGVVPLDKTKHPKCSAWLERLKQLPYYEEANGSGADGLAQAVLATAEKNSSKTQSPLSMTKPVLYTLHLSPPCRAVHMTAKALGVDLEHRVVNLLAGEHLKPEFIKINPQHTIPVLDDNGIIISESHAIMIYLVSKYGKDDSLYPGDLVIQAKVNAALHFESGVLFARTRFLFETIFFQGCKEIPDDKAELIQKAYQLLEDTLVDDYLAGDSLTIADFSCIATVASVMGVIPMDESLYPKIYGWVELLKELPYYEEANGASATEHAQLVLEVLKNNASA